MEKPVKEKATLFMRWIVGVFSVLIFVFTLIVSWAEKSGGACYKQRNSQREEDRRSPLTVDGLEKEQESPQQTNNPAADSESYLCRLIAPANLPNIYLVLVGIGGIFAAIGTLDILKRQTNAIERQTKAVEDSIALQKTLKRQWLNLENWRIMGEKTQTGEHTLISLMFNVINSTDMELKLKCVELFLLDGNQFLTPNVFLVPTKSYSAIFHVKLSKQETENYFRNSAKLLFIGILHFKDNFGDRNDPIFGEYCDGGVDGFEFRAFDRWLSQEEDDE